MDTDTIKRQIRTFISSDLQRDLIDVTDGSSLLEAGIIDSLGVLTLVAFIEERYRLHVEDDELMPENFESIEAVASFVARRRSTQIA